MSPAPAPVDVLAVEGRPVIPVILVHLGDDDRPGYRACADRPMPLDVGEDYAAVPRLLCPLCRAFALGHVRTVG